MSQRNSLKPTCGCAIDRLLRHDETYIFITGAQKQSDSPSGKSYIAYCLRIGDIETKRRYSEFESFRKAMTLLHPALIVPPIPEKHSLVDYAALQTRVKDDLPMIEKRKRMLQTFLNRIAKHPELGKEHIFHLFLESGVSWSDVLHSPPLSTMPKNPLQMVVSKSVDAPTHTFNPVLSSNLIPSPSAAYQLQNPDPRFEESEKFTFRIANYMNNNLDKSQRKVIRRLGELANDYAELGAVYNGFSLNETGEIANAIEKIGQAVDVGYTETGQMVTSLEGEFAEPIQEHAQFAQIIKQVLKFRHMKHAQVEMIETSLNNRKEYLNSLQNMENEARRLEAALTRDSSAVDTTGDVDESLSSRAYSSRQTTRPLPHNSNWAGKPMRVISAVGHTLQNIIDANPEATRRNQIGMSKDAIHVLEEALSIASKDLGAISTELQSDLDRFQKEKIQDLRDMLIAYAKIHIRYCQKNLEAWQEARAEVEKIPI
ncbi:PX-domain-containing protein [Rhizopus microsporus var. microsporus]|uniref:PX-domain-containing protein n=2 Tax=Rhizopus microsporus TaxID=58291 RepID=A0A2G4SR15_RHIZD|nr:PX-domain-containing protein [Rhizopus microsporus ATCC 52813]ORE05163.1 PX-domain-containing protein [Rhizopus microsporus var. microsporus]PHZ11195.1 PX-domain-containing protein [Rhizopus microsporus ATCC 52813]